MKSISLSTAFVIEKAKSWNNLLSEVRSLGFGALELNVQIPGSWMPEILAAVEKGEISIPSVHNYCPAIEGILSNRTIFSGYLLTSDDEKERDLAVKYTLKTVEWAEKLNSKAVVIHAGEIETDPSGKEFYKYAQKFGPKSGLYNEYFKSIRKSREENGSKYFDRILIGLDKILNFALKKRVLIGLENRMYYNEIPDIKEMKFILEKFSNGPIGYWHDTGHAEIFVRNGWTPKHTDFLEPFKDRIIGFHLHDIKGLDDHYAPGCGDFDFSVIKPYISQNTLMVIEAHPRSSSAELKNSVSFLEKRGLL